MKKKYRIKKRANNNEFSKLTGIEAFEMLGGNNCLITKYAFFTKTRSTIQSYAYSLYSGFNKRINPNVKVTATCGATNCVKKAHLKATYEPTKKEADYIAASLNIDSPEQTASVLNVPLKIFTSYQKRHQQSR